ncbi:MAG: hypothetical protein COT81_04420 [Candidatus Buchananbacteria bacterium CG10_big_fil_rev_8_21_14_0_10_42_9]|uniref:Uncharacterized protein n=1 Tax=Candidatus Buchananbacteria bacterium CG10_big_fil_rev_8_21_14_0_10_42_9 TaxID=1974526 RepID=A0A2H0W2X9_9BACT|nr:MAG: hypothetical protein COT81_04420 [Candidatus Buchananbacteria bacterium CG10_big_fil_rev_8_21_14_0_10_42_9]
MSFSLLSQNLKISLVLASFLLFLFIPLLVGAEDPLIKGGLEQTIDKVNEGGDNIPKRAGSDIPEIAGTILNYIASLIGVIMVILILVGGFRWMTAGGNEEKVAGAKKIIISAIDGLLVIFLAYAVAYSIVYFLINAVNQT